MQNRNQIFEFVYDWIMFCAWKAMHCKLQQKKVTKSYTSLALG